MYNPNLVRRVYFPNLNGLRFLAAFGVIVHHTEHLKLLYGLPSVWNTSAAIAIVGKLGVVLFFVLSGFLITYLLLVEEQQAGRISVMKFYIRRALRIWPLYYFVVALALFILPYTTLFIRPDNGLDVIHQDLQLKLVLYVTFLANVVSAIFGAVPFAALTWSVATEEQFYLIWPILMRHVRSKLGLMLAVIALYLTGRLILETNFAGDGRWLTGIRNFYALFNIDCMAIGGLAAVLLHKKSKALSLLVNLPVLYGTLFTTVVLVACGVTVPYLHYEFYSVLFAVLILNFATNQRIGWSLEFEPFHYLGNISYGLYLLHPIAIVACIRLLTGIGWTKDVYLYPACLLTTIGLAALSSRFFESPFLRLKRRRFAIVVSGGDALDVTAKPAS